MSRRLPDAVRCPRLDPTTRVGRGCIRQRQLCRLDGVWEQQALAFQLRHPRRHARAPRCVPDLLQGLQGALAPASLVSNYPPRMPLLAANPVPATSHRRASSTACCSPSHLTSTPCSLDGLRVRKLDPPRTPPHLHGWSPTLAWLPHRPPSPPCLRTRPPRTVTTANAHALLSQRRRGVGGLVPGPVLPSGCTLHSRVLHTAPLAPERRRADADKASSSALRDQAGIWLTPLARSPPMAQARIP